MSETTASAPPSGAEDPVADERDLYDPYLYINREISWLQFNDRVLAMAADPQFPLLERLKYLAIFSSNLDEFFMVRVSGLRDQVQTGMVTRGSDGWTPSETLEAIAKHVGPTIEHQVRVFLDEVSPAMAEAGIRIADISELNSQERDFLRDYFHRQVFPVLTPLAVDPSHPFPYISNLSLSLAVTVRYPGTSRDRFARVKVPGILPRFVPLGDGNTFVPLEQVVASQLDKLFPGMNVVEAHPFRVTRDADIELAEDEADDLLVAVEQELRRRRFG
ncbi:MAG TPA: RNA degradosome polyphosphate kinase, partial [Actinomycetes bacterium]|nr:RNA degradosome polyphosphate kinase [Actinomycetes bacterium]